jgi:hypothetical protein
MTDPTALPAALAAAKHAADQHVDKWLRHSTATRLPGLRAFAGRIGAAA